MTKEGFRHPREEEGDSSDNYRNINALRKDLIKQYPQHQSIFEYSDLFHPSSTSYTDINHDGEESKNTLLRCHRIMTRLREMDNILLNAQRQGRISFYLTCRGEEATYIGSASALEPEDVMLAQYREQGLLMWRGFTLEQFTNQCYGNDLDLGRGRYVLTTFHVDAIMSMAKEIFMFCEVMSNTYLFGSDVGKCQSTMVHVP